MCGVCVVRDSRSRNTKATLSRIRIVDDQVSLRGALRQMLGRAGHTVFDASDGREGMALWRREPTEIVLTGWYIPEQDGVEVLLEMKRSATTTKVVMMSGGGHAMCSTGVRPRARWGPMACS